MPRFAYPLLAVSKMNALKFYRKNFRYTTHIAIISGVSRTLYIDMCSNHRTSARLLTRHLPEYIILINCAFVYFYLYTSAYINYNYVHQYLTFSSFSIYVHIYISSSKPRYRFFLLFFKEIFFFLNIIFLYKIFSFFLKKYFFKEITFSFFFFKEYFFKEILKTTNSNKIAKTLMTAV